MCFIVEFVVFSFLLSGIDFLYCGLMSKIWNGSEDMEFVGSWSNCFLMSCGLVFFWDL